MINHGLQEPLAPASAAATCQHLTLSSEAAELLTNYPAPAQFFRALLDRQLHEEALMFLGHWLPKRVAVWWGCLCNQLTAPIVLPETSRIAFQATLHWVVEPNESHRLAALRAAEIEECRTASGLLAYAAAWSGGSLKGPELPVPIPPPDHLTGRLVGAALLKAASQNEPMAFPENYRHFLGLGMQVALGQNLWTASGSITRQELENRVLEVVPPTPAAVTIEPVRTLNGKTAVDLAMSSHS